MCNPALALMAIGTAMQYKSQQDAVSNAKRELGQVEDRNDRYNEKIMQTVDENAQQYDPQKRLEANDQSKQAAITSLTEYLNKARDAGMGTINPATQGRVSNVYDIASTKRTVKSADTAATLARLMGKVRGPVDLRTEEGFVNADAASRVGLLSDQQMGMAHAGQIDVSGAAQPDLGLAMVGGGLEGYGAGKVAASGRVNKVKPVAQSPYGPVYSSKRGPYIPRSLFKG